MLRWPVRTTHRRPTTHGSAPCPESSRPSCSRPGSATIAFRLVAHPARPLLFGAERHEDGNLFAWNTDSRAIEWTRTRSGRILGLAIGGEERLITLAADGALRARDATTGRHLLAASVGAGAAGLAVNATAETLAVTTPGRVSLLDAATLEPRSSLVVPGVESGFIEFLGERLLAAGDAIRVIVPADGRLAFELPIAGPVSGLAVAPDQQSFAVCDATGEVTLRDARTGSLIHRFHRVFRLRAPWSPMTFSWDGRRLLVADNPDRAIRLLDPTRGVQLLALLDHQGWCNDLAFGYRGERIFCATVDLHVWRAPEDAALERR